MEAFFIMLCCIPLTFNEVTLQYNQKLKNDYHTWLCPFFVSICSDENQLCYFHLFWFSIPTTDGKASELKELVVIVWSDFWLHTQTS